MKKLRHPINSIREPFGTAGLIVAMIALVAALGGTAFAAAKLNSTQKKEVEKIAKKFAGKPGAAGANGTNGTNGSPGAKGDTGAAGKEGPQGKEGPPGKNGTNGKNGNPWTLGGTLPASTEPGCPCTETGSWAGQGYPPTSTEQIALISFPIPLAERLKFSETASENHVHFINKSGKEVLEYAGAEVSNPPDCPGTAADPKAEPGNLCIYTGNSSGAENEVSANGLISNTAGGGILGTSTTGAYAEVVGNPDGTWAVTAP